MLAVSLCTAGILLIALGTLLVLPMEMVLVGGGLYGLAFGANRFSYFVFKLHDPDSDGRPDLATWSTAFLWTGFVVLLYGLLQFGAGNNLGLFIASMGPTGASWVAAFAAYRIDRRNAARLGAVARHESETVG